MNENEIIKAHKDLRAQRDAFVPKLTAALQAAGFTVTGTMPTADWAAGVLTITKPGEHKGFIYYATFDIKSGSRLFRHYPNKLELKWGAQSGYRSGSTRFSKLNEALVIKLVQEAKNRVKMLIESDQSRAAANADQARWEHHRAMELAGMTVPPGATVSVVMGNSTSAGKYTLRFERNSITDMYLTREQVIRILDVLNEVQNSASLFVITGINKNTGDRGYFTDMGWWQGTPVAFPTKDAAQAVVAKMENGKQMTDIEVAPYAQYFTIRP